VRKSTTSSFLSSTRRASSGGEKKSLLRREASLAMVRVRGARKSFEVVILGAKKNLMGEVDG
jgi:hypothetical protein